VRLVTVMKTRAPLIAAASTALALFLVAGSAQALRAGARAPEIGLRDLDGNQVTMAGLRGNVVVVDFWASWCEPCPAAMAALQALYERYGGRGLRVVGVSQDRDVGNVRTFLRRHPVTFPIVHDGGHAVADRYRPSAMPSSFVIDRRGVVRHVHAGFHSGDAAQLEREIRQLLGG
jgi:cytochrome c biogenesis protein CcmG/thiol:disulfide interchange protein DsbE